MPLLTGEYWQRKKDKKSCSDFHCKLGEGQVHRLSIKCADQSTARISAYGIHIPTILDELRAMHAGAASEWLTEALLLSTNQPVAN